MVESFLTARDKVRKANKKQGIAPSTDMDGLLLYMLPSHMWFGGFLNESQDALNKIQKKCSSTTAESIDECRDRTQLIEYGVLGDSLIGMQ